MPTVQKRCQLPDCARAASTLCFCCNKNVCTRHFTEHIEAVRAQIDPLANEVNTMVENIGSLSLEKLKETSLVKLRQWQIDMRRLVDQVFEEKSLEIESFCQANAEKFEEFQTQRISTVMAIQDDIRQLAEDGDATVEQIQSLESQLRHLGKEVDAFEKGFLVVKAAALADGLVHVASSINKPMPSVAGSVSTNLQSAREGRSQNVVPSVTPQAHIPSPCDQQPPRVSFGVYATPTTKPSTSFEGCGASAIRSPNAGPSGFSFASLSAQSTTAPPFSFSGAPSTTSTASPFGPITTISTTPAFGLTSTVTPTYASFGASSAALSTLQFGPAATTSTGFLVGSTPASSVSTSSTPYGTGFLGFGNKPREN